MSACVKSLLASLRVKVSVALSLPTSAVLLLLIAIVGAFLSESTTFSMLLKVRVWG